MLEQRDADIKSVLKAGDMDDSKKEKLKELINSGIDFHAMGASALGRHWEPLTEEQRTRFVSVFGDIVRSQSVADLEVYQSSVTYGEIVVDGNEALVNTEITYKDAPTSVVYKLVRKDTSWWVTDIILKDVSTVDGYARSFQSVVRKKGFDTLMTKLEERQAKIATAG
ncbi:MAG: ABC transporter substrate-binding protein [Rhodothermales bacterium]|nr:ABC transporter substrate-binding protein [Rhodothermales bacterium]